MVFKKSQNRIQDLNFQKLSGPAVIVVLSSPATRYQSWMTTSMQPSCKRHLALSQVRQTNKFRSGRRRMTARPWRTCWRRRPRCSTLRTTFPLLPGGLVWTNVAKRWNDDKKNNWKWEFELLHFCQNPAQYSVPAAWVQVIALFYICTFKRLESSLNVYGLRQTSDLKPCSKV